MEAIYFHAMEYEDRMTIATPEGVELELTLAGLGSRFIAAIIDQLIMWTIIGALALVLSAGGNLGVAVFAPLVAAVLFGYDVLFEVLANGRTPGKRWNGLRVVRGSGAPVDLRSSAVRNLIRILEAAFSYLPAIVSILATKRNQRLGDLAADTVVVRDRGAREPHRARIASPRAAPEWDVSGIGPEDLVAVRSFLERRHGLPPDARRRVARQLDAALRGRVGGVAEPDAERFLEGLLAAKLRDERA